MQRSHGRMSEIVASWIGVHGWESGIGLKRDQ